MSGPDDLVAPEGVDDGSAAQTAEAEQPATAPAASPGPRAAGVPTPSTTVEGGGDDVLGEPPHGAPDDGEQDAAPVDMESAESRRARDERGPGQQVQAGEG